VTEYAGIPKDAWWRQNRIEGMFCNYSYIFSYNY